MTVSVEKIKKLRKHNGWSQERLADISGISLRTIQRIENGDNASLESQLAIASAFNMSPSELMNDEEVLVGNGGINWSGILGLLLCFGFMVLQFRLGSAAFFDLYSLILVVGLSFAMSVISLGVNNTVATLMLVRWVLWLPKNEIGLQKYLPSLHRYILYCHIAGAISTLVGIIAVFMTPDSYVYQYDPAAKFPELMGVGVALLTSLYAAMLAEFILRPLKHQIERLLIQHQDQKQ